MKKEGKKILCLLMLLWKNYGGGKPAAIQTRPDRQSLVMGSDRIAAHAMAHVHPPCFSHKTLRGDSFDEIRGNYGTLLRRRYLFLEEKNQPVYWADS